MFGSAIIRTPRRGRGGLKGKTYDCGERGKLTVRQIALLANLPKQAIQKRLAAGWTGERLCLPRYATRSDAISYRSPPRHALLSAFKIAKRFPDRVPTIAEIKAVRPMSDRTAGYWRNAIAEAHRELAA